MNDWRYKAFDDLSLDELYQLLKLRQDVFVLEQACLYPELDGLDADCFHLFLWDDSPKAYLRCIPPGRVYPEAAIGRVVVAAGSRGGGIARELMIRGIQQCRASFAGCDIRIGAQTYLESFYLSLGFIGQ